MRHIWGVLEIVGTVYADSLKSMATSTIDAAPTHCVNSLMMSASGAMPANLTDISKLNKGGKWHEKILYINRDLERIDAKNHLDFSGKNTEISFLMSKLR